jgi:hypothetical protein
VDQPAKEVSAAYAIEVDCLGDGLLVAWRRRAERWPLCEGDTAERVRGPLPPLPMGAPRRRAGDPIQVYLVIDGRGYTATATTPSTSFHDFDGQFGDILEHLSIATGAVEAWRSLSGSIFASELGGLRPPPLGANPGASPREHEANSSPTTRVHARVTLDYPVRLFCAAFVPAKTPACPRFPPAELHGKEELRVSARDKSNERVRRTHPKSNSCVHGQLPAGAPTGAPGRDTLQIGLF